MEKGEIRLTNSSEETRVLGEDFVGLLKKGDVIALSGPLGSGKTTFAQGVARGLGIKKRIISPTFVLIRQHSGKLKGEDIVLYHIDLYRMEGAVDIRNLGLEEILGDKNGIFLIEWAARHRALNPSHEIQFALRGEVHEIILT